MVAGAFNTSILHKFSAKSSELSQDATNRSVPRIRALIVPDDVFSYIESDPTRSEIFACTGAVQIVKQSDAVRTWGGYIASSEYWTAEVVSRRQVALTPYLPLLNFRTLLGLGGINET